MAIFLLPFTNGHELNLDWILEAIKSQETRLQDFVALNTIKYADPFQWDITSQYAQNTLVMDPQTGTAYLSTRPVPAGTQITNAEYWTPVANISGIYNQIIGAITKTVYSKFNMPAAGNIEKGSLVWIDGTLYKCVTTVSSGQNIQPADFKETDLDTEFQNLISEYKDLIQQTTSELDSRISTIIANGQQTEGNTELIDIRTGWNGTKYPTAGDAVRAQTKNNALEIQSHVKTATIINYSTSNNVKTVTLESLGLNAGDSLVYKIDYVGDDLNYFTIAYVSSNSAQTALVSNLRNGAVGIFNLPSDAVSIRILCYRTGASTDQEHYTVYLYKYLFMDSLIETVNTTDQNLQAEVSTVKNDIFNFYVVMKNSVSTSGIYTRDISQLGMVVGNTYHYRVTYGNPENVNRITIAAVNSNGDYIGNLADHLTNGSTGFIHIPENTVKIRLLFYLNTNETEPQTIQADFWTLTFDDYFKKAIPPAKKVCCLGDSFTASNNSWWTYIADRLKYTMVNRGVAGTRMTVTYTAGSLKYESFIDRVNKGAIDADSDLVIVFGGINDTVKYHNKQCTIGTVNDPPEYDPEVTQGYSFIGRVKYLIDLIYSKVPGVPILGVIPPDYSEGTSNYEWWYTDIADIQEALRQVYAYYGIPYVDLKNECQEMHISDYNLRTYRINGINNMHPSTKGYEAISKVIQKDKLEKMFVE